jgi:hypothetical protein
MAWTEDKILAFLQSEYLRFRLRLLAPHRVELLYAEIDRAYVDYRIQSRIWRFVVPRPLVIGGGA